MKGPGLQSCDPNGEQQYPRKEPLGDRLVATSRRAITSATTNSRAGRLCKTKPCLVVRLSATLLRASDSWPTAADPSRRSTPRQCFLICRH
jgi:hypothetical protein